MTFPPDSLLAMLMAISLRAGRQMPVGGAFAADEA
jgi:hypothetical protein